MEKQTLIERVKSWFAGLCFRLFIWANSTTEEEYWDAIYEQEYNIRHPPISFKLRTTSTRGLKESLWDNTRKFYVNERRSGRTSILIAEGLKQLLLTGEVIISDHYHGSDRSHTVHFYDSHIFPQVLKALANILTMEKRDVMQAFDFFAVVEHQLCSGLYIKSKKPFGQYL